MRASVGIDCGSAACKGILMLDGEIAASAVSPTGWNPRETSENILAELLSDHGLSREEVSVVATGYGRIGLDFADKAVTEITCHALGANYLLPDVRTVIDIGGQDSKVISVEDGKVMSFQMNDKCAAGTGRFLEMSIHRMGISPEELPILLASGKSYPLSSMCAVFADSEIVSLLAAGKSREEIVGGVIRSVAARAVALAARVEVNPPILLTGGLADLDGLRLALESELGMPVISAPYSRYAGAVGAALVYK